MALHTRGCPGQSMLLVACCPLLSHCSYSLIVCSLFNEYSPCARHTFSSYSPCYLAGIRMQCACCAYLMKTLLRCVVRNHTQRMRFDPHSGAAPPARCLCTLAFFLAVIRIFTLPLGVSLSPYPYPSPSPTPSPSPAPSCSLSFSLAHVWNIKLKLQIFRISATHFNTNRCIHMSVCVRVCVCIYVCMHKKSRE